MNEYLKELLLLLILLLVVVVVVATLPSYNRYQLVACFFLNT